MIYVKWWIAYFLSIFLLNNPAPQVNKHFLFMHRRWLLKEELDISYLKNNIVFALLIFVEELSVKAA